MGTNEQTDRRTMRLPQKSCLSSGTSNSVKNRKIVLNRSADGSTLGTCGLNSTALCIASTADISAVLRPRLLAMSGENLKIRHTGSYCNRTLVGFRSFLCHAWKISKKHSEMWMSTVFSVEFWVWCFSNELTYNRIPNNRIAKPQDSSYRKKLKKNFMMWPLGQGNCRNYQHKLYKCQVLFSQRC